MKAFVRGKERDKGRLRADEFKRWLKDLNEIKLN